VPAETCSSSPPRSHGGSTSLSRATATSRRRGEAAEGG
jgi:hypothetical protein